MKQINLVGQKFGRLLVISENGRNKNGEKTYLCQCDCGNTITVRSYGLRCGETQSCGCLQKERTSEASTKHGDCKRRNKSSLYSRYKHMIWRCNNPNCKDYDNYGGRGIKVCKEWLDDYKTFKQWAMDNGYEEHLTIDRIDVNGNYEPDNCRWITLAEQENNRRDNVYLTYQGITKTASQWSKLLGIKPSAIYYLKRKQLSDDDIFRHFPQIAEVLAEMRGVENDE